MPKVYTYPLFEDLEEINAKTPAYMRPNMIPFAAIGEGWLSDLECERIHNRYENNAPYSFSHCNAITRECPRPLDRVLDPMIQFALEMNSNLWQYEIVSCAAWLQTYTPGRNYQKHMDVAPGQSRKLTAVLMLSPAQEYDGGHLQLWTWPDPYVVPKTQGTIVVFPSWLTHEVTYVDKGMRSTINLGFWGPEFK